MSRIGKLPISIPAGVTVTLKDNVVTVKGPKGELSQLFLDAIHIMTQCFLGQQIAFLRFAGRVTDHTGRAAHQCQRLMTATLEMTITKIWTFIFNFNYDTTPLWYLYMLVGLVLYGC